MKIFRFSIFLVESDDWPRLAAEFQSADWQLYINIYKKVDNEYKLTGDDKLNVSFTEFARL